MDGVAHFTENTLCVDIYRRLSSGSAFLPQIVPHNGACSEKNSLNAYSSIISRGMDNSVGIFSLFLFLKNKPLIGEIHYSCEAL